MQDQRCLNEDEDTAVSSKTKTPSVGCALLSYFFFQIHVRWRHHPQKSWQTYLRSLPLVSFRSRLVQALSSSLVFWGNDRRPSWQDPGLCGMWSWFSDFLRILPPLPAPLTYLDPPESGEPSAQARQRAPSILLASWSPAECGWLPAAILQSNIDGLSCFLA